MASNAPQPLASYRLLVLEDELLIALELQHIVEELGATVVGPVQSIDGALRHVTETAPDAALLDVNIQGQSVLPVARACRNAGIPFVLVTGYGRLDLEEPLLQSAPRVSKPFNKETIREALSPLFEKAP